MDKIPYKINEVMANKKSILPIDYYQDPLSAFFLCTINPYVVLERILLESQQEYIYLFNEYNIIVNSKVYQQENLLRYYDYGYDDFTQEFLVLREQCDRSLQQIIQRRKESKESFKKQELLSMTLQLVKGLTHLEVNGVFINNLKPTNIFSNSEVHYKIGGLGRTDKFIWINPIYCSPELRLEIEYNSVQSNINKSYENKKSSVYNLGLILLEAALLDSCEPSKDALNKVEEKYNGYRIFLEALFLENEQRPDFITCYTLICEMKIEDDIIMIGDSLKKYQVIVQEKQILEVTQPQTQPKPKQKEEKKAALNTKTKSKRTGGGFSILSNKKK